MAESDYTPEFIDTLSAWERNPPLSAEFVFDLPPDDRRKADKVGVLMYQAVLMKQDHPDLDFSRLRAVTFTMDVHRTGAELERIVGHDLPQFRNAAARLEAFHVNLGAGQVLIITDELAAASISPLIGARLAAWELLRNELARSVAVARLEAHGWMRAVPDGSRSVAHRWRVLARFAWTEYFCGFHAAVEGMQTPMARERLRQSLEEDPLALSEAARQFERDRDLDEWVTRAEGCVKGLFEAMAEVLGQLAAAHTSLDQLDPHLETLVRAHALTGLWDQLGAALASSGDQPAAWQDQEALAPIARLGQQYLAQHGLRYADGAVTAVAVSR